jgi:phage major head subunit gpT-like protein
MARGEFAAQMAALLDKGAYYRKLATKIQSNTVSNTCGWPGDFPSLREWVGDRVIKDMKEAACAIVNKKYESTLGVDRAHIEDDNLGVYRTRAQAEANAVIRFFERGVASLLRGGFESLCYDGQPFFDMEHPVYPNHDGTGEPEGVSNIVGAGDGSPWFLLCLDGVLKPFILQERNAPEMTDITDPHNDTVFMKDKYLFGVRQQPRMPDTLFIPKAGRKTRWRALTGELRLRFLAAGGRVQDGADGGKLRGGAARHANDEAGRRRPDGDNAHASCG